jgi:hypothetical protein
MIPKFPTRPTRGFTEEDLNKNNTDVPVNEELTFASEKAWRVMNHSPNVTIMSEEDTDNLYTYYDGIVPAVMKDGRVIRFMLTERGEGAWIRLLTSSEQQAFLTFNITPNRATRVSVV